MSTSDPATSPPTSGGSRPTGGLLTKGELAAELRCSVRQIERLQHARKIPFLKISGRMIRYRRDAVFAALAKIETETAYAS
jgi:excisionase family DNA binding protein